MVFKLLVVSDSTSPSPPLLLIACCSSPSLSITSPVSEELPLPFTSPDLAFQDLSMNDPDPLQAYQYPPDLSFLANDQPYKTPPKQSFFRPVALPEVCTPNMSVIPDQNVGINNTGAIPRGNSFPTVPPFSETALGLYYPSPPRSLEIPPLSTQADASILSALPPSTNSCAKTRKVRAVVPTARTIRVRSGRMHAVATAAAAAITASTAFGTGKNSILECDICGFRPTTLRKADLRRHEKTHQDARYVCCGIPDAHPAAAGLDPVCSVRCYKKCKFLGGSGKSYSRMDALQRHSGKSGCASGSAKDYQIWRQLYF